jgi:ABC-type transport system involved in multi-copper enzyme maturation permease subunit
LLIFAYAGPVIIAVLGALAITPEYSTGMIRATLAAQPRRGTVYAAKVIVLAAVALAVSLVTAFAAFGAGQAMLSGQAVGLSHAGTLRAITGAALYVTATALIAFGLGTIVRNAAGTIALSIGVLFVVQVVAQILPSSWQAATLRWLPTSAWQALTATTGTQDHAQYFAPWGQLAVTMGYSAVLLVLGVIFFCRRDA